MIAKARRKKTQKDRIETSERTSNTAVKDVCFAIMPFGGWFDDYYNRVFKPAIEDAGMEPHRADDLFRPSSIVNDIWTYTQRAVIVLADLTDRNPNVFYELGLAHAIGKPAILVVDDVQSVPFDLRSLRLIEYDKNDPNWGEKLKISITKSINEIRETPLKSVLPAFLEITQVKKPEVTERERDLLALVQEMEQLRQEVRVSRLRERSPREIDPDEARALIRGYLGRGESEERIIRRLAPLGPPPDWISKEIRSIMDESLLKGLFKEREDK